MSYYPCYFENNKGIIEIINYNLFEYYPINNFLRIKYDKLLIMSVANLNKRDEIANDKNVEKEMNEILKKELNKVNQMFQKIYSTNIVKNPQRSYSIKCGGAIMADNTEVICWLPLEIARQLTRDWDLYDFSLDNQGNILKRAKR